MTDSAPVSCCARAACAAPSPAPQPCGLLQHAALLPCDDCGRCRACCEASVPRTPDPWTEVAALWDGFVDGIRQRRAARAPAGPRDRCTARRLKTAMVAYHETLGAERRDSWFAANYEEPVDGVADQMCDLVHAVADGALCWVADVDLILAERRPVDDRWSFRAADRGTFAEGPGAWPPHGSAP